MASLDDAIARGGRPARLAIQDGRKAAVISFDVTTDGFRAVPRPHLGLIAGGLAISLEANVRQGSNLMSAFAPTSCNCLRVANTGRMLDIRSRPNALKSAN